MSPHCRQTPQKPAQRDISLLKVLDLSVAFGLAAIVIAIHAIMVLEYGVLGADPISLTVGLLPSVLLCIRTFISTALLLLIAWPCGFASYVLCDIESHPAIIALLHPMHYWLPLFLLVYGLFRLVALLIEKVSDDENRRPGSGVG